MSRKIICGHLKTLNTLSEFSKTTKYLYTSENFYFEKVQQILGKLQRLKKHLQTLKSLYVELFVFIKEQLRNLKCPMYLISRYYMLLLPKNNHRHVLIL